MKETEIRLQLKLKFKGEYPEDRIRLLMTKVSDALYSEYSSGEGFAPDDLDDVFTEGTEIKFDNIVLIDNYYDNHTKGRYTYGLDFEGQTNIWD